MLPVILHDTIERSDRSHVLRHGMLLYCYSKREKSLWNAMRVELLSNVDRKGAAFLQRQKAEHAACLKAINPLLSWQCTYLSSSGVPRNFVRGGGGGSTNSFEDRGHRERGFWMQL